MLSAPLSLRGLLLYMERDLNMILHALIYALRKEKKGKGFTVLIAFKVNSGFDLNLV